MDFDEKLIPQRLPSRAYNPSLRAQFSPELDIEDLDSLKGIRATRPSTSRNFDRPQTEAVPHESSRAVAMAMKALQTKIRGLETDNEALHQTVQDFEERYLAERERWQEQTSTLQQTHAEKEQRLLAKIEELQGDLDALTFKFKEVSEAKAALEGKRAEIEAEIKLIELNAVSHKSHLHQKVSDLQSEVEDKTRQTKKYKTELGRLSSENSHLASSLKQSNDLVESLQQELTAVHESSDRSQGALQENILHMEEELSKLNAEYVRTVNNLEDKNYELNERHREDTETAELLRKEIEGLKVALAGEEEARMKLLKRMSDMPAEEVRMHEDYRHELGLSRETKLGEYQYGLGAEPRPAEMKDSGSLSRYIEPKDRRSKQSKEPDLSDAILKLEAEIVEVKRMYRRALKRSYTEQADLSQLRGELNAYTKELEDKNMLMYKLKRQRQGL
jgi:chromosome segregation ATPase